MSPTDERHGSYAGHIAHRKDGEVSCQACKAARTRYEKRYRVYGGTIVQLGEAAYAALCSTPRTEVERAGLHSSHITRIKANGPDGRVSRKTRDIILKAARQEHVTRVGAMRRLQALAALGWSTTEVAKVSGVHATNLGVIRRGATKHYIRRDAAAGIAEAYRVLSMRIPPEGTSATWTRTYARNNGWLAPLWWDDERIDDPTYRPTPYLTREIAEGKDVDEAVVRRVLDGEILPTKVTEKYEIMRRWLATGRSERSLCVRMGWKEGRYGPRSVGAVLQAGDTESNERKAS